MFDIKQSTEKYMSVVLTHACNKACPFCIDAYRGRKEYISIENVKRAAKFACANGITDILLVGGEPTLHPQVVEIAKIFKASNLRVILTTNYTLPHIVKELDGIVDCFNISFYNQKDLPRQVDFKSDLTLHTLIHAKQLGNKDLLDIFIIKHRHVGHLKFSTLSNCNDWTNANSLQVDEKGKTYLDYLDCEWTVLFNEILGQIYCGTVIKRYDRQINDKAIQSFKFHVDGEISESWKRKGFDH